MMKYSRFTFAPGCASPRAGQTLIFQPYPVRVARLEYAPLALTICLALALSALPASGQVGHIHQLFSNGSTWTDTDLTSFTAAQPASAFAGMSSFVTADGALHVNYQDQSANIHQLYYVSGIWYDANLTSLTSGAPARSGGSGMAGFASGNQQFVYFVGWDQHIHEYYFGGAWQDGDLTAITGSPAAGPAYEGKQLAAVLTPDGHRHIFYVTNGGYVMQLLFNGSAWSKQNLTGKNRAHANTSDFDFWLGACHINNYPFVFFSSPDLHLHEFSDFRGWLDTDLTAKTGVTTQGSVSVVTDPGISVCGVYYNDPNDGHVHHISNNGTGFTFGNDIDLAISGGTMPVNGGAGFSTSPGNWERFFTRSQSGVNQFTFNGTSWSIQNVPGGNYWEPYGVTGFSIGGFEYVYYLASSN